MTTSNHDLIIIGAGPGGYELAAAETRRGLDVVLIERDHLGGTCLNRGCIPTKCLCATKPGSDFASVRVHIDDVIDSLRQDIAGILKGCTLVTGDAHLDANGDTVVGDTIYHATRTVIATGSRPASLPIPGAELALTSDDILSASTLPDSLCIIGGGVIGMEMASALHALGVKVTVLEFQPEILPGFERTIARRLRSTLSRRGIDIKVGAAAQSIIRADDRMLTVEYTVKNKSAMVMADAILMAVGRRPVVPEGLDLAGIEINRQGAIIVNDKFETTRPGVFAIGDCCSIGPMLAHVATAQAMTLAGRNVNLEVIPSVVFTTPHVAMVGMTPAQADEMLAHEAASDQAPDTEASAKSALVTKVPYGASGYARAAECTDGLIMTVVDPDSHRLMGVHIIGSDADLLIGEASLAVANNMTTKDVLRAIHPHPTLTELLPQALHD